MKDKTRNKWLIIIAICSFAFAGNANSINNPCLAQIYEEFSNGSEFLKSFIVSGPMIVALPFILIIGKVADRVNKKDLVLGALAVYLVGGIGGAFAPNIEIYAVCRALVGVAMGVTSTIMFGILFTLFTEEKEKARVMGYYQGATRMVGAIVPIVAGTLGLQSWRTAAWLNAIAIITFVCVLLFLPRNVQAQAVEPKSKEELEAADKAQAAVAAANETPVDLPRVILALAETFALIVFGWLFFYYNALYIAERGIGTSVLAGTISTTLTIAATIINFFLAPLTGALKRYSAVVAGVAMACCFLVAGLNIPVWMLFVITIIYGFGASVISSYTPIMVNAYVPKSKVTFYQSVYSCVTFAAFSLVSYVPNFYRAINPAITWQQIFTLNGFVYLAISAAAIVGIKLYVNKKQAVNQ